MSDFFILGSSVLKFTGRESEVCVPVGIASISDAAFAGHKSIRRVTLPYGVREIGNHAFAYCSSLESILLPDSVTEIGQGAFSFCKNLRRVVIPKDVTVIPREAFKGCEKLEEVVLHDRVTEIHENAFCFCVSLRDLELPASLTYIGKDAFLKTPWQENQKQAFLITDNGTLVEYNGAESRVEIPEGVKVIGRNAFRGQTKPETVIIPDTVETIGDAAFSHCGSLGRIEIPDSVKTIVKNAFEGCTGLRRVTVGSGICNVEWVPFDVIDEIDVSPRNPQLSAEDNVVYDKKRTRLLGYTASKSGTTFTVPEGVRVIGKYAFAGCGNLREIILPKKLDGIGKYAFADCKNLEKLVIPPGVMSVDVFAFRNCGKLTEISLPRGVAYVAEGLFSGCGGLRKVTLPDSVRFIGRLAFEKCGSLRGLTVPDSVTSIEPRAFLGCVSMERLVLPEKLDRIGYSCFENCDSLRHLFLLGYDIDLTVDVSYGVSLEDIQNMIRFKNYGTRIAIEIKYQFISQIFLRDGQAEAESFIRKNLVRFFSFFIRKNDYPAVKALFESGRFVNARNIGKLFNVALSNTQAGGDVQIQAYISDYRKKHFPDEDPLKELRL